LEVFNSADFFTQSVSTSLKCAVTRVYKSRYNTLMLQGDQG